LLQWKPTNVLRCTVEQHATVNNIKKLSIAKSDFAQEFMSPAKIKRT
jgi:hypothetical protein